MQGETAGAVGPPAGRGPEEGVGREVGGPRGKGAALEKMQRQGAVAARFGRVKVERPSRRSSTDAGQAFGDQCGAGAEHICHGLRLVVEGAAGRRFGGVVGLRRGSWGMSWTGAALLQQPQGWEGVWRGVCGPQPCGKQGRGVPAPFCQLVFNPWAERRFFSLVGGGGGCF